MKPIRRVVLAVACVVTISAPLRAQQGVVPNPNPPGNAPKIPAPAVQGLMIEPDIARVPPVSKFTNGTKQEIAIIYGAEKFKLKPGENTSVPIPPGQRFPLKVFEVFGKDKMRQRYEGVATPNDPKREIPLNWEKPKKAK